MLKHLGWMALTAAMILPLAAQDDNRPARGVARISLLQGDVSVRRGDSGEWLAAAVNAPLVVTDRLVTGAASRAEVQLDYSNFTRLASNAEIRFSELEYARYILQLAAGTITHRVLRDLEAEVEISTPSVSVRPMKRGEYRISVHADGTTEITVRSGEAEIFTPQGVERLRSGRTMIARGSQSDPEFQVVSELREDEWDDWNQRRDRELQRSQAYRYVDRSVYGAEVLDSYGSWVYDAPYGWVWAPRVAVGWAPYRYGRWTWVDWYGWSWVSYDPWGWAPYHYGRWYYGPRGWCWWPGGLRTRHYWSPGLVAWFGFGGRSGVSVGVGFGWGRVGWVPLAPFESYHPWYGWNRYRGYGGRTYVDNRVTIVNNVNVTNIYRNARVRNGVTGIDAGDFSSGRGHFSVAESDFRQASLVRGELPLAPGRNSLRFSDREARVTRTSDNERFYSRRSPGNVERVTFDEQRRGVEELSRRTFGDRGREGVAERRGGGDAGAGDQGRSPGERGVDRSAGRGDRERIAGGAAGRGDENGWRRLGADANRADSGNRGDDTSRTAGRGPLERGRDADGIRERNTDRTVERAAANSEDSGWRRFGEPRVDRSRSGESTSRRTVDRAPENRNEPADGGWRRFGQPADRQTSSPERQNRQDFDRGSSDRGVDRSASPQRFEQRTDRNSDSGWRRFGEPGSSSRGVERRSDPGDRMERQPRSDSRSEGRSSRPVERQNFERSQPLRMSPPIVRERRSGSTGGFERSESFGSGSDRGSRSVFGSPRSSGGSMPRIQSAPRGSSGGVFRGSGGGGMRSGGGGGSRGGGGRGRGR